MPRMPALSAEQSEELYRLYITAFNQVGGGIGPKEARNLQIKLREALREIWDAEPRPVEHVFDDFRRIVMQQFLDRSRSQDPQYRRAK
jgi:hypothetical protein